MKRALNRVMALSVVCCWTLTGCASLATAFSTGRDAKPALTVAPLAVKPLLVASSTSTPLSVPAWGRQGVLALKAAPRAELAIVDINAGRAGELLVVTYGIENRSDQVVYMAAAYLASWGSQGSGGEVFPGCNEQDDWLRSQGETPIDELRVLAPGERAYNFARLLSESSLSQDTGWRETALRKPAVQETALQETALQETVALEIHAAAHLGALGGELLTTTLSGSFPVRPRLAAALGFDVPLSDAAIAWHHSLVHNGQRLEYQTTVTNHNDYPVMFLNPSLHADDADSDVKADGTPQHTYGEHYEQVMAAACAARSEGELLLPHRSEQRLALYSPDLSQVWDLRSLPALPPTLAVHWNLFLTRLNCALPAVQREEHVVYPLTPVSGQAPAD